MNEETQWYKARIIAAVCAFDEREIMLLYHFMHGLQGREPRHA